MEVIVVIGAGQIGQAIACRVGVAKHVQLAGMRLENANAAAEVMANARFDVSVATVEASSRDTAHALVEKATGFGEVLQVVSKARGKGTAKTQLGIGRRFAPPTASLSRQRTPCASIRPIAL